MTAPVSNIPISVDYTSRDYYALREDLIELVKSRVNTGSGRQWSGEDPSDFGVALLEAFAYIGDLTNYYIDRIANETYLPTATQRSSILNLARLYGYAPTGFRAAQVEVEFSNSYSTDVTNAEGDGSEVTYFAENDFVIGDIVTISSVSPSEFNLVGATVVSATPISFTVESDVEEVYEDGGVVGKQVTIPEGAQISGTVIRDDIVEEVFFTTLEEAVIPPAINGSFGSAVVWAKHGEDIRLRPENEAANELDISGELLGTSDGSANQIYPLSENQVVTEDIEVYVEAGDIYEPWRQVTNLIDFGPSDAVYRTELDENNFVSIIFGDGVSGAIPNNLSGIKATYYAGGGTVGNISVGVLDTLEYVPNLTPVQLNSLTEIITVGNPRSVGVGGAEPEDNTSIRRNASLAIRAINRVVSFQDYESLALFVENVGKANATADVWTSVTLYVAPVRNQGDLDKFPGFDGANDEITSEWLSIRDRVIEFFEGKTLIGASLQVSPPTYVPASLEVVFSKTPNFTSEQAEDAIKREIVTALQYVLLDFQQTITPEQIESILNNLPSVRTARLSKLYRTGNAEARVPLIGSPAEIFVFLEANVAVVEASDNAQLTTLTTSSGTLSPVFNSEFYSYNLVGVTAETVTFTPVGAVGAAITVNGTTAATPVTLGAVGSVTTVPITVVAADGTTVRTYTVSVYRTTA
jgi:hypothetical protein